MKTTLTDQTLVDLMVVLLSLDQDERDQIKALSGNEFNAEKLALGLANALGPKYTIRMKDSGEPLVVAGLIPVGATTWRTWFFANPRAWEEHGREITLHTARVRKDLLESVNFARIETVCLASRNRKVFEWYETCGMEYESTMQGYGTGGESAVMYVSTKGSRGF